jgi:predicted metal-dependent enzyme (double-stranded beta helix superfamily)
VTHNQSTATISGEQDNSPQVVAPEIRGIVTAVRDAVARRCSWDQTARLVADALKSHLPTPDLLTASQRLGDPNHYNSLPLYVEPDGAFSIVALVWRPGQETPIHDHVTWCVFGVIQGAEYEELFTFDESGRLVAAGDSYNPTGSVNQITPPGDIHRVRNVGDSVAISIHIYGTDVRRLSSSVRRIYDPPAPVN